LVSHALLETGNGTSELANGVKYKGKTVYNMYGIGANDGCAVQCGAKYAYQAGWFTPEKAIIGGAKFIREGYIDRGQDTLYKMRWNPAFAASHGYASHQYATDIGWAYKQTYNIYTLYDLLDSYNLILDLPRYK
jgi:mannosyl-glycoprotein endo-beta-N-acetylglucosaminidase